MQPWAQENANVHRGELSTRISFSYACAVLISQVGGKNSSCVCHHCQPTLVLISQLLTALTVYFGWKEITTINDFLLELHLVLCCILTLSTPSNSSAASWHDWLGRSEAKRLTNSRINLETERGRSVWRRNRHVRHAMHHAVLIPSFRAVTLRHV